MTNWRHIRRKSPGTSYVHPAAAIAREEDQFLRGRHQREQDSKTSSYVPLSRREDAKCFLCGEVGHFKSECPQLGERIAQKSPGDDPAEPEFAVFKPLSKDRAEGPSIWQESSSQPKRTFSQPEPSRRTLETGAKDRSKGKGRRREQTRADDDEDEFDPEELAARKRQRKERKAAKNRAAATKRPSPIYLPEYISVSGLAVALRVRLEKLITKMEELGFENIHHDHVLNVENAGLVAMEYGHEPVAQGQEEIDLVAQPEPDDKSHLPTRAPVVTIMGHVDHGKTTLLDYLRKSSVAATEFGGITQHIGAFSVPMPSSNRTITFLDTPGHAAFLSMRARGANVTDIVVLVVAADDGVMPQTVEAIKHAQEASVPVIVAINKCDKEEASPERCKQDLARHGIQVEDYGGDTQAILVSGKTGQGMEDLEEAIGTLSEILDHRADPAGPIEGWILEATTRKGGRVATVLVRRGTLRQGDILVAGRTWTRVRKLCNEAGVEVVEVGPGMPIEVDGWRDQPVAGDEVLQAFNEERATEVVEFREEEVERQRLARDMDAINAARRLEQDRRQREEAATRAAKEGIDLEDECREAGPQTVPVIIKADVSGSADAVQDAVAPLGNSEVHTQVLRSGVGPVSESDVDYAAATRSLIIAFNVPLQPSVATMAEAAGVRILESNIIYRTTEKVREELSDRLAPLIKTRVVGEAEVLQQFDIGLGGRKKMRVAGCKIRNGMISRGGKVRVLRRDETVHDGIITSLKSGKKDVMEMSKGTECGLAFGAWQGFETGDQIQAYEEISEKRFV
ncbi:hypothetical protein BDY21DRAFT_362213 [Lineolata rhizophorae]|uniref:Translation initiation factor IF-2, mitochondrial n=1 Tax=Lineolata rhizophorae TaxID=578093 RepID=A0A6A6P6I7_9PEZI|nr:hypothetical protein BDY21DRAFT_362213 [Lineolata rhizophorae]